MIKDGLQINLQTRLLTHSRQSPFWYYGKTLFTIEKHDLTVKCFVDGFIDIAFKYDPGVFYAGHEAIKEALLNGYTDHKLIHNAHTLSMCYFMIVISRRGNPVFDGVKSHNYHDAISRGTQLMNKHIISKK